MGRFNHAPRSTTHREYGHVVDAEAVEDYKLAASEVGGVAFRGVLEAGKKHRSLSGKHMAEVPEGKAFVRFEVPKGQDASEYNRAVEAHQAQRQAAEAESFARTLDDIKNLPPTEQ